MIQKSMWIDSIHTESGKSIAVPSGLITNSFVIFRFTSEFSGRIRLCRVEYKPWPSTSLSHSHSFSPRNAEKRNQGTQIAAAGLQWLEAINKELQSLRDKDVYEVRKIPPNRKLIPH